MRGHLYHGTSLADLGKILSEGLRPRGARAGNFGHGTASHPEAVYLTDTYPAYYAVGPGHEGGAIVEIDVAALDAARLRADEDFLAASSPGGATPAKVRRYRDSLPDVLSSWEDSLTGLGTCAYLGTIPPSAFTRVATIDFMRAPGLACAAADMSISLMNFRICGFDHRAMLAWIFGDPEPDTSVPEAAMSFRRLGFTPGCDPTEQVAITVMDMKKGPAGPLSVPSLATD
jgi:hypothetical protein